MYDRVEASSVSDRYRMGGPIYEGYRVSTWRDSPSVVFPDGRAAVVIRHPDRCPRLSILRDKILKKADNELDGNWPAYYFPERTDPKVVWILADEDRYAAPDSKRYFFKHYRFIIDDEEPKVSLAQNVPAAWEWYERAAGKYRRVMKGISNEHAQSDEEVWSGIFGCVLYEDEWRNQPEFVKLAAAVKAAGPVKLNQPGADWARNCNTRRTPHISLLPSENYSRATIDLDRNDLRSTTITTPYLLKYRDRNTTWWVPEICVSGEGCTGFHPHVATWLYLPVRRAFIRLEREQLETYRFYYFAVRFGDGL